MNQRTKEDAKSLIAGSEDVAVNLTSLFDLTSRLTVVTGTDLLNHVLLNVWKYLTRRLDWLNSVLLNIISRLTRLDFTEVTLADLEI